ncbi:MAG: hypothetical protein QOF55_2187 [Thermoleophilaceae bacterium]|nr:hypothetical protein [Thermoleophilaceae bacterium]
MTPLTAEAELLLRDGSALHVRPITPDDRDRMRTFLGLLSESSRRLRFFSGGANLDWAAGDAIEASFPGSYGIVATREDDRIVAHAMYAMASGDRAEVAFAVADEMQGMGIATKLLAQLAEAAEACGICWFEAEVLPENHRMLDVFRDSGFAVRTHWAPGVIHVEFPTTRTSCAPPSTNGTAGDPVIDAPIGRRDGGTESRRTAIETEVHGQGRTLRTALRSWGLFAFFALLIASVNLLVVGSKLDGKSSSAATANQAPAGRVTFNVHNSGTVPHEFVVLHTAKQAGSLLNGARADEAGNVGEIGDLAHGAAKSVAVNLKAGHHALVCNLPSHYSAGQHTDFTVK